MGLVGLVHIRKVRWLLLILEIKQGYDVSNGWFAFPLAS